MDETKSTDEWKNIGFHRPLGGLWFNYVLVLFAAVFALLFMFYLMPNYILPFPEAIGFQDIIKNLFAMYFMLADVGVGRAVQKFVAEENIKNPLKALQYLQFFIWFQMITGLIQVTFVSVWALEFLQRTELAYATWFIIIYSTIQFPGMLGIFQGALSGFQRFDKANLISFFQAVVLENSTRVVCILLGRWLGIQHPAYGELVGATIGSIVGAYLDDFLAAAIAAHWTRPLLKEINPRWGIKDMFRVQFDRKLMKDCLWFGIKSILPSVFHQANQFLQTMLLIQFLPNYSTVWGLFSLAETVSGIVGLFKFSMTSTVSEAYNNGKIKLVQDYQIRSYRWIGLSQGFLVILIFSVAPLLGGIAGEDFILAAPMIQVMVVGRVAETYGSANADIFMGCNKPEYYLYTNAIEAISRFVFLYVLLVPLQLGWIALAAGRIAGWWFRWFSGIFLIRRLFKFKINFWQTFIVPILCTFIEYFIISAFLQFIYLPMDESWGMIPAAVVTVLVILFIFPFFVYFPMYAFFGGFDDRSLEILDDAVKISGPSKVIMRFVHRMALKIAKFSPLHNKFPIEGSEAKKEIAELMEMRRKSRDQLQ
ncbi:MAG: hypothetical protein ACFFCS_09380 [Candidatus Hodarchaeota archaeon]